MENLIHSMIVSFACFINSPSFWGLCSTVIRNWILKGCVFALWIEAGEILKAHRHVCYVLTYLGGTLCSKENETVVKVCLVSLCAPMLLFTSWFHGLAQIQSSFISQITLQRWNILKSKKTVLRSKLVPMQSIHMWESNPRVASCPLLLCHCGQVWLGK